MTPATAHKLAPEEDSVISARDVVVVLNKATILHGVDFSAEAGCTHGIIGPTGAGKSTLLRVLANLISPVSGTVNVSGRTLFALGAKERARVVAFMPQETVIEEAFTVRDFVMMGRYPYLSRWQAPSARDREVVEYALERTGSLHLADRLMRTLSGGQRQLISLSKQLAQDARVLLLDEPVSALDIGYQIKVLELVNELAREGRALVVVMHDLGLAARYCHHLTAIVDGRVMARGTPREVITPELLEQAYRVRAQVGANPATGSLQVTALEALASPSAPSIPTPDGDDGHGVPASPLPDAPTALASPADGIARLPQSKK